MRGRRSLGSIAWRQKFRKLISHTMGALVIVRRALEDVSKA